MLRTPNGTSKSLWVPTFRSRRRQPGTEFVDRWVRRDPDRQAGEGGTPEVLEDDLRGLLHGQRDIPAWMSSRLRQVVDGEQGHGGRRLASTVFRYSGGTVRNTPNVRWCSSWFAN